MRVTGWRCAVCDATVGIATPFPWRCPNSTDTDRHHVLTIVNAHPTLSSDQCADRPGKRDDSRTDPRADTPPGRSSLIAHDHDLAWAAYADANGLDRDARTQLVEQADAAVRRVAGTGFVPTPFGRSDHLSDALGFAADGGIWVKDETGGVAGSQKARHLVTILLHLLAAERIGHLTERPRLAIASCGNAALAAATLAAAVDWPIDVYVPTWMTAGFGTELDRLGATVHRCERRADDPPGDPAMLRFRDAVAEGAIPFTVQGPENALALDGGRSIGWEIGEQAGRPLDRVFVQVGGGAFAACLGAGLADTAASTGLYAVQTEGCAPLARAWDRAQNDLARIEAPRVEAAQVEAARIEAARIEPGGLDEPGQLGRRWSELMTVWDRPQSNADGILDDETYDWLGVFAAMQHSGGTPVVASEADVVRAHDLARAAGYDVSATGSAGLAGVLAQRDRLAVSERVAVVMSGVRR
jgi:threonine dehydratase